MALKYGSKRLIGYSVFFTSIFTIFSPIAARIHYILFIACRSLEGLAEVMHFLHAYSLIEKKNRAFEWFPQYNSAILPLTLSLF